MAIELSFFYSVVVSIEPQEPAKKMTLLDLPRDYLTNIALQLAPQTDNNAAELSQLEQSKLTSLLSLCRSSRQLSDIARPILYYTVHLEPGSKVDPLLRTSCLPLLVRSLALNPSLRPLVRNIRWTIPIGFDQTVNPTESNDSIDIVRAKCFLRTSVVESWFQALSSLEGNDFSNDSVANQVFTPIRNSIATSSTALAQNRGHLILTKAAYDTVAELNDLLLPTLLQLSTNLKSFRLSSKNEIEDGEALAKMLQPHLRSGPNAIKVQTIVLSLPKEHKKLSPLQEQRCKKGQSDLIQCLVNIESLQKLNIDGQCYAKEWATCVTAFRNFEVIIGPKKLGMITVGCNGGLVDSDDMVQEETDAYEAEDSQEDVAMQENFLEDYTSSDDEAFNEGWNVLDEDMDIDLDEDDAMDLD